ncbi:E3 ubiquitin-protein ligase MIB2-like [Diadema antillarum]|uniref:E3 ubiquitin-protein ligase MIB2-like n=1 Tax=Diadema antillarum TaxID=105358 RepID=UPI003A8BDC62
MAAAGVGSRVVRGPSWDYGDQDGGEGVVGTVVEIGKGCFEGWAVVQWDYGSRARYRIGRNDNEHDLLLLDSACAGVQHRGITCDGKCTLSQVGYVTGIRWKCAHCSDFDLCNECYMNDEHVANGHTFVRINTMGSPPVQIPSRRNATKVPMRGLFQGATVKRSRFWQGEKEDGLGDIVCVHGSGDERVAEVRWRQNKGTFKCQIGGKSIPELICTADGDNSHYYKDHLPAFGEGGFTEEGNKGSKRASNLKGTKFVPGDRVAMTASPDTLSNMGLSKESQKHVKEVRTRISEKSKSLKQFPFCHCCCLIIVHWYRYHVVYQH